MPVDPGEFRVVEQISPAQNQEDAHDRQLHDHDGGVEVGRFLDADDQDRGDDQDGKEGDKVEDAGDVGQSRGVDGGRKRRRGLPLVGVEVEHVAIGGGELRRQVNVQLLQQAHEVSRPAGGHGGGAEGVFEHQVPADDPGDQLAQGGIAIGVGGAGDGNDGGELRVAKPGKGAGDAGKDKAESDRWTGVERSGLAGQHEDPGADDGADAEGDEVDRAERAPECVFPHLVGLFGEYREGFGCQESRHRSGSSSMKGFGVSVLLPVVCSIPFSG